MSERMTDERLEELTKFVARISNGGTNWAYELLNALKAERARAEAAEAKLDAVIDMSTYETSTDELQAILDKANDQKNED